jgi:ABC-type transport system substrate-binding protein
VAPTATTPPAVAKITRVSMANPPPLTENNRIWSAAWSILLQHDPYGETLIENDPVSSEPVPALAKSWEVSNGFKTWTFELEEGVPWHFGHGEFTSADVGHTFDLITREDAMGNFKSLWESGGYKIIDDYNIEFNFDPAMVDGARLFSRLAGDFVIQSKAQWDAAGGADTAYDEMPAGTGSYQYGGRDLGSSIWYEKAPGDHWAGENPDFQELEWVWATEQFTRLSLLLAGEVQGSDLSRDVYPDALGRGMKVLSSNNENNQSFGLFGGQWMSSPEFGDGKNLNYEGPLPWNDIKVREAMNRAIDREAIMDAVFGGEATPVIVPAFAPFTEGWNPRWVDEFESKYGYDPDLAVELLAEAGYGPGDISIKMQSTVIPGNAEIPLVIETLSTMWEEVGINTEIQDMEIGTWLNSWTSHETHGFFSLTRNTPIRTTQEGLRIFFIGGEDGFFHGFDDDYLNQQYFCIRDSVDAQVREDCARNAGDFMFDNYTHAPMFQITFDMVVNPEYISSWQYPGVGSAHPTHVHNIRACPVGTDRCD